MKPSAWRKAQNLSLDDMAGQLGLRSRGRLSTLLSGKARWPTDLAIQIDRLTAGAVTVAELRPDLSDVRVVGPDRGASA